MTSPELFGACSWLAWFIASPLLAACAMIVFRRPAAAIGLIGGLAVTGLVAALGYRVLLQGPQHTHLGGWIAPLGIRL